MNKTNDPDLRSFISVSENSHFPIQNLPYGIFKPDALSNPRVGVAIGDWILDLSILESEGFFEEILGNPSHVFSKPTLNSFLAQGTEVWQAIRIIISNLLSEEESVLRDHDDLKARALVKQKDSRMLLPVDIGDYTDFYSSREHAHNVGSIFRSKENALLPNWSALPVAYHGRASSIIISGRNIIRPSGQFLPEHSDIPVFGPTEFLDFELELGYIIGPGNPHGHPLTIDEAESQVFGAVLVNDWSARDIQRWEYQPLGPFQSKSFATSISPWIVTLEALQPFICSGPVQKPDPLPNLKKKKEYNFNINLSVSLQTERMSDTEIISRTNARHLYWDILQQVTHHTANGCNLRTGDLLATGTISGPEKNSGGSLLELAWNKTQPLILTSGETREALEDGDLVIINGWCTKNNFRLGFGPLSGKVVAGNKD